MIDFVSERTGLDSRFDCKSKCITDIMFRYWYEEYTEEEFYKADEVYQQEW
jgi:hypothetical protein